MHIGIQLLAPNGFGSLVADQTYYLLCNRPDLSAMTIAWFCKAKSDWRVHLVRIPKDEVAKALQDGRLTVSQTQASLPPWLQDCEGISIDSLESNRRSNAKTYRERAQERLGIINPLLTDEFEREFDGALRPEKLFKRRLRDIYPTSNGSADNSDGPERQAKPKTVNHLRAYLWYCTFRLFGKELHSLLPAYNGIGCWERCERNADDKPLGRPPKRKGAAIVHSSIGLAKPIQDSYAKYCGLGVSMVTIHSRALTSEFGCKYETLPDGEKRPFHPENLPFPSYQQFRYRVLKHFGLDTVQKNRIGEARFRSRRASPIGSFSQDSANYLETAEADVYQIPERPRQLLTGEAGPPLMVCRIVDMATANIVGVGFGSGSETAEAYRLAKFCSVVPRQVMGRLFGIKLDDEIWPGRGLPSREIVDRGPGASPTANGNGGTTSPSRELAPSWSGQSKATVEASHPRNVSIEGEPTYTISKLNACQMAVRELLRTPAENERKDATGRLTPEMLAAGVAGNPKAITKYLLANLRTSAIPMSTEAAIRQYLRPADFELKPDGLWLDVLRFSHGHLHEHGLPTRVASGHRTIVKGYIYPLSLYLAWVEIDGKLHEVEPQLRIRDDPEQLLISLADLEQVGAHLRDARAKQRAHGAAAMSEAAATLQGKFGISCDTIERKRGRVVRPKQSERAPNAAPTQKGGAAA